MTDSTTFYWYDFETFGLDRRSDRPAQFAGMRTDMDLNPVSAADLLYAKPAYDYLPQPESCLVTGLTPQTCEEKGVPESDFAGEIWSRFNQPGTIGIGYNTSGFDNEVARFLFWRNFLDPYSHQWRNGCSCWDLFPLVCAVWALRGKSIKWPLWKDIDPNRDNGTDVCFKLEHLTKANGLVHSHAHDALSDVEATVGLASLIRQTEPKLWQWALANRTKEAVRAAVEKGPVVWLSPKFGQKTGFMRVAAQIPIAGSRSNEALMWDLSVDPSIVSEMSDEDFKSRFFSRRDELPEGIEPLPIYRLAMNASPFVCSNLKVIPLERQERFGVNAQKIVEHWNRFRELGAMIGERIGKLAGDREKPAPSDVAFGLYDGGFASRHDAEMMAQVRRMTPERLAQGGIEFDDDRFETLLLRYRARNWPETLSAEERRLWTDFCRGRLIEARDDAMTVTDYFNEIDRLQEDCWEDDAKQSVLEALYEWGERMGEACAS